MTWKIVRRASFNWSKLAAKKALYLPPEPARAMLLRMVLFPTISDPKPITKVLTLIDNRLAASVTAAV